MATPGREVLDQLRRALEESRSQSSSAVASQQQLKSRMDQIVTERGAAVMELARHDLPDLTRESIQNTFAEIQRDLLAIADRRDRAAAELQSRIARLLSAEQEQTAARVACDRDLNQSLDLQKRLEADVRTELQQHPEFPSLSKQAVVAEEALHRDEKRVAEVQAEAADKLPAYERSSLFQYLYRRRFLTEEYQSRGLTRRLDRWIASLIGYVTAVRGYEFLKKTPLLMQEELDRRREVFHGLMSRIEGIEKQVAERLGLTAALDRVKVTSQKREALNQQIAETRQMIARSQAELGGMDQAQSRFYQEALERYRQFLGQTQTTLLDQHAARSPGLQDDQIVSRICGLTATIEQLQSSLPAITQRVASALGICDGLEFLTRRMEQSQFHEPNSRFEGLNLEPLLERFRQGVLSKDALWSEIKQHQRFEQPVSSTSGVDAAVIAVNVLTHPMTRVLAQAMVDVVGTALQQGVDHSLRRRSGGGASNWTLPSFPTSSSSNSGSSSSGSEYSTVDRI